jgi:hypothetical protein
VNHDGKGQFHFLLAEVPVQPAFFIGRNTSSLSQQVNPLSVGLHQEWIGHSLWTWGSAGTRRAAVVECLWNRRHDGASGASCQGWQLCAAWNKCFTTAAPGDLIKKVVQKCVCPFSGPQEI